MQMKEAANLSYFSRTLEGLLLSVSVDILDGSSQVLHRQNSRNRKRLSNSKLSSSSPSGKIGSLYGLFVFPIRESPFGV